MGIDRINLLRADNRRLADEMSFDQFFKHEIGGIGAPKLHPRTFPQVAYPVLASARSIHQAWETSDRSFQVAAADQVNASF